MANIGGINPASGPRPIQSTAPAKAAKTEAASQAGDTVEISPQAQIASKMAGIPDVRADLVAQVKADITAGTYETPAKLDAAIANLLAEA